MKIKSKRWLFRSSDYADVITGVSVLIVLILNLAVITNLVQISWFQSNIQNITLGFMSIFILLATFEKHVHSRQLQLELIDELKKIQTDNLQQRVRNVGISNLYLDRTDYVKHRGFITLGDYLSSAQKSVKVIAHWLSQGVEMEGVAHNIADIVKSGKNVEIAVINPDSPTLKQIAGFFDLTEKNLRDRINNTIMELLRAKNKMQQQDRQRFKIKTYDTLASASVILLDDEEPNGRVQIDIKLYKTPRQKSFGFEVSGRGNQLYDLWRNSYVNLIDNATEVDSNPNSQIFIRLYAEGRY